MGERLFENCFCFSKGESLSWQKSVICVKDFKMCAEDF